MAEHPPTSSYPACTLLHVHAHFCVPILFKASSTCALASSLPSRPGSCLIHFFPLYDSTGSSPLCPETHSIFFPLKRSTPSMTVILLKATRLLKFLTFIQDSWKSILHPLLPFFLLNWSIIALQWCASFRCTTKCISYMYTYIPPSWTSLPRLHPTHLGHHRAPGWALCAIQQVPTSYLFYTW